MRRYRFDAGTGRPITAFGSHDVAIAPILRAPDGLAGHLQIACMHLAPGGVIGHHQAVEQQLFLVVAGAGWVRGAQGDEPGARQPITAGEAALWQDGEWHESGTEGGMVAIVIEGAALEAVLRLPAADEN